MSRHSKPQVPYIFLLIITLTAIALFIQLDRMQKGTSELRTKAYQQTSTGIRIDANDMTVTNGAIQNTDGGYIQF